MEQTPSDEAPFRPFKKRRTLTSRPRLWDGEPDAETVPTVAGARLEGNDAHVQSDDEGSTSTHTNSMAELLRRRQLGKTRRAGIGFQKMDQDATTGTGNEMILLPSELAGQNPVDAYTTRFTKQTGQKVEVEDKHMLAYIDSKISSLRDGTKPHQDLMDLGGGIPTVISHPPGAGASAAPPRAATSALSRLQEIDLGPDATLRNIERTEAARRRIEQREPQSGDVPVPKPRKPRLGRDGKPWRPRKRRNSDDVKRDAIVEALLRENKVELFSPPTSPSHHSSAVVAGTDEAADERLAEQFKREYMEQQVGNNRTVKKPAVKGAEDKAKGPKMGGSRNARAIAAREDAAKKR